MNRASKYDSLFLLSFFVSCLHCRYTPNRKINFITAQAKRDDILLKSVTKKRAAKAFQLLKKKANAIELQEWTGNEKGR